MATTKVTKANRLPNGCVRSVAEQRLALYEIRKRGGYKNQIIAERRMVKFFTGMSPTELRKWLAKN